MSSANLVYGAKEKNEEPSTQDPSSNVHSLILLNSNSHAEEDCKEIMREDVCGLRHQKSYGNSENRFLTICTEGDVEDLVAFLDEFAQNDKELTPDILNEPDSSGRVPVSYLCGNGLIEILEILEDVPGIDYNIPDKEGNTCLHFASQAGHVQVVSFLLNKVRTIRIDPINNLGFTPLMKAAIQGRVKCSRLLLFSGASPSRRDYGRGLTASQWAKFCGRYLCADSIEKFVRNAVPPSSMLDTSGELTGSDKFNFRSIHSSSREGSSWISRKLKKAFHKEDFRKKVLDDESGGASVKQKKLIIPQVQITPIYSEDKYEAKAHKKKEKRIW